VTVGVAVGPGELDDRAWRESFERGRAGAWARAKPGALVTGRDLPVHHEWAAGRGRFDQGDFGDLLYGIGIGCQFELLGRWIRLQLLDFSDGGGFGQAVDTGAAQRLGL